MIDRVEHGNVGYEIGCHHENEQADRIDDRVVSVAEYIGLLDIYA